MEPGVEEMNMLKEEAIWGKFGVGCLNWGRWTVLASKQTPCTVSVFVRPDKVPPRSTPAPVASGSATPAPALSIAKEIATAKLDINTASPAELESIPGIGPAFASRIIAARPFKTADDLIKVEGIGAVRYGKTRPYFQ